MADFTVTLSLTGSVNGRTISVTNAYTVEDVDRITDESSEVDSLTPIYAFGESATHSTDRGPHNLNAPKMACFQCTSDAGAIRVEHNNDSAGVQGYSELLGQVPQLFHHGENFGGSMNSDAGPSLPDPTVDTQYYGIEASASGTFRAFALLKNVS